MSSSCHVWLGPLQHRMVNHAKMSNICIQCDQNWTMDFGLWLVGGRYSTQREDIDTLRDPRWSQTHNAFITTDYDVLLTTTAPSVK